MKNVLNLGSPISNVPFGVKNAESGYFDLSRVAGFAVVLLEAGEVVNGSFTTAGAADVVDEVAIVDEVEVVGLTLPSSSFERWSSWFELAVSESSPNSGSLQQVPM